MIPQNYNLQKTKIIEVLNDWLPERYAYLTTYIYIQMNQCAESIFELLISRKAIAWYTAMKKNPYHRMHITKLNIYSSLIFEFFMNNVKTKFPTYF